MYGGIARGMQSYDAGASAISARARAYRSDVDNIKSANKSLVKQAEQAVDLTALRDIGAEGALRMFKPQVAKGLKFAYEKTGLKDWDIKTTKKINDWRERMGMKERTGQAGASETNEVGSGRASTSAESTDVGNSGEGEGRGDFVAEDEGPSFQEIPGEEDERMMMGAEDRNANLGRGDEEGLGGDQEMSRMEDVGGRAGATTGEESQAAEDYARDGLRGEPMSQEDLDRVGDRYGMRQEDFDAPERPGQVRRRGNYDERNPTEPEGGESTGMGDAGVEGEGAGETALTTAGETAAETGADVGGSAAAEGIGDALIAGGTAADATGIGAIIGVPAQILGGLVELFGGYETAKGIGEWFDQDVLGHHPQVNKVPLPKAPQVDNANLAIPSFDSVQDAPTSAGGW